MSLATQYNKTIAIFYTLSRCILQPPLQYFPCREIETPLHLTMLNCADVALHIGLAQVNFELM